MTKSLIVEGWRFLSHSNAVVNQWQLLSLLRRPDVAVKVVDAPFYNPAWRIQEGLFDLEAQQALKAIEPAGAEDAADVTLRIFYPLDFSPTPSRKLAVFGNSEYQVLGKEHTGDADAFEKAKRAENIVVITPSRWSAEGFYKAGFAADRVVIVPHGVDAGTFRPMPDERARIRKQLMLTDDNFAFLAIGAMTWNKGIDVLLAAFSEVNRKFPNTRLVLKGSDTLYSSRQMLLDTARHLPAQDQLRLFNNIRYSGRPLSNRDMALLYQAADLYVSPYRAEGFNIPVLEAAACGVPIVCTHGGSTDDFVTDTFARKIESKRMSFQVNELEHTRVEPNLDHLTALMTASIEDAPWRQRAREAGPTHVLDHYGWDGLVDSLIRKLWK